MALAHPNPSPTPVRPACLSRLRITGFKSFAAPAALGLLPGLTGLVGSNGCGKSNVVDALRWAMGDGNQAIEALTLEVRQHARLGDRGDGWPLVVRTTIKPVVRMDRQSTKDRLAPTATRHVPPPMRARVT